MDKRIWMPILLLVVAVMGCAVRTDAIPTLYDGPDTEEAGFVPYKGGSSQAEIILAVDTIARVELVSTSTSIAEMAPDSSGDIPWAALLEFRFRVLEYLKGSGPNEIVAVVTDDSYYSKEEARAVLQWMADYHDSRWDDRQAIVFLSSTSFLLPSLSASDRFYMSVQVYGGKDGYTVASPHTKLDSLVKSRG